MRAVGRLFEVLGSKKMEALVTLVSLGFAVYTFVHRDSPSLLVDITSEANVLDVHKSLSDLAIYFKGEDIEKENLNLRILTIRVTNNGKTDILQGHYDQGDIWGLQVGSGRIIETRMLDSNSDYIKANLQPRICSDDRVQFKKIIFESGKFFILELLVLHNKGELPDIIPIGKIAGIDRVVPSRSWTARGQESFVQQLFHGSPGIHIIRLMLYLIVLMGALMVSAAIAAVATNPIQAKQQRAHRTKVDQLLGALSPKVRDHIQPVVQECIEVNGRLTLRCLQDLKALLDDEKRLGAEVRKERLRLQLEQIDGDAAPVTASGTLGPRTSWDRWSQAERVQRALLRILINNKAIDLDEHGNPAVDPGLRHSLEALMETARLSWLARPQ